jgi:hypothetical protein
MAKKASSTLQSRSGGAKSESEQSKKPVVEEGVYCFGRNKASVALFWNLHYVAF